MTLPIAGLLLVTLGALGLSLWVFLPRNKPYFEDMAKLALDDAEPKEQGSVSE